MSRWYLFDGVLGVFGAGHAVDGLVSAVEDFAGVLCLGAFLEHRGVGADADVADGEEVVFGVEVGAGLHVRW